MVQGQKSAACLRESKIVYTDPANLEVYCRIIQQTFTTIKHQKTGMGRVCFQTVIKNEFLIVSIFFRHKSISTKCLSGERKKNAV